MAGWMDDFRHHFGEFSLNFTNKVPSKNIPNHDYCSKLSSRKKFAGNKN